MKQTERKGKKEMNTVTVQNITPAYLRQAADALEQLEQQLDAQRNEITAILAGKGITVPSFRNGAAPRGRNVKTKNGQVRHFSPEALAGIRAGQKKRWANARRNKAATNGASVQAETPAPAAAPATVPAQAPTAPAPAPASAKPAVVTGAVPAAK